MSKKIILTYRQQIKANIHVLEKKFKQGLTKDDKFFYRQGFFDALVWNNEKIIMRLTRQGKL